MDQPGEIDGNGNGVVVATGPEMEPPLNNDKPSSVLEDLQERFTTVTVRDQSDADMPGEELFGIDSDEVGEVDMELTWNRITGEIEEEERDCPEFSDEVINTIKNDVAIKLGKCDFALDPAEKDLAAELEDVQKTPLSPRPANEGIEIRSGLELETEIAGAGEQLDGSTSIVPGSSPPSGVVECPKSPIILKHQNNNLGEGSPPSVDAEAEAIKGHDKSPLVTSGAAAPAGAPPEPEDKQVQTENGIISENRPILPDSSGHCNEADGQSKDSMITAGDTTSGVAEGDSHHDVIPMEHDGDNPTENSTEDQSPPAPAKVSLKKVAEVHTSSPSPKLSIGVPVPPKIILPMRRTPAKLKETTLPMNSDPLSEATDPNPLGTIPGEPPMKKGKHDVNSVLECLLCQRQFLQYEDNQFRKHLVIEHNVDIETDCFFAQRTIPASTTPGKPLKHGCGICGDVFYSRYELWRHIQVSHERFTPKVILYPGFRCAQCLKGFKSSFELTDHCLKCSDKYPSPDTIRELANSFLECDICGMTHANTDDVSNCYFDKNILRCVLCLDIFKIKGNLHKHLNLYHGLQLDGTPKFTFPCPFCKGSNPCLGRYQEIFPHVVADHYQPSLDAVVVPSPSSGSGNMNGANHHTISMGQQQREPGMPVVMSVVGNYIPPTATVKLEPLN